MRSTLIPSLAVALLALGSNHALAQGNPLLNALKKVITPPPAAPGAPGAPANGARTVCVGDAGWHADKPGPTVAPAELPALRELMRQNDEAARKQYVGRAFEGTGTVVRLDMNPLDNPTQSPMYDIVVDFGHKVGEIRCTSQKPRDAGANCVQDPTPLRPGQAVHVMGAIGGLLTWDKLSVCHWDIASASALPSAVRVYGRDVEMTTTYSDMLAARSNEIQFAKTYPYGKVLRVTGLEVSRVTPTEVGMVVNGLPNQAFSCEMRASERDKAANLKPGTELAIAGIFTKPKQAWLPWSLRDCTFDEVK